MSKEQKLTKREAIEELRKEAEELENKPGSFREYARNVYRAKIRRQLADKFEKELEEEVSKYNKGS